MKAFTLKENGGIENLKLSEIEMPKINAYEVLVKVKAISINPVDALVRQNKSFLQGILKPGKDEDTFILGWDISGIVEETGSHVKEFKKGDNIFGMVNFPGNGKAYAEYVVAPANQLALKPDNISFEEAAAATLAALTAWQGLVTHAKIQEGDKVLIHAAGGGVGHYAVQIAKSFETYIIGTGSSSKRDFVLGLGANEFIDYTSEKFEDNVKDADIVFDSIKSSEHLLRSIEAAKKGGRVISIKSSFEGELAEKAKAKNLQTSRILVSSNGDDMKQIATLLEEGKIHSHVSQTFSFADLPKAHQQIETGKTLGKIVVQIYS
jgi:NADPH:quinone reductase-like Zn-dependent oxidoreductase